MVSKKTKVSKRTVSSKKVSAPKTKKSIPGTECDLKIENILLKYKLKDLESKQDPKNNLLGMAKYGAGGATVALALYKAYTYAKENGILDKLKTSLLQQNTPPSN